jgi:hypothetical protein
VHHYDPVTDLKLNLEIFEAINYKGNLGLISGSLALLVRQSTVGPWFAISA